MRALSFELQVLSSLLLCLCCYSLSLTRTCRISHFGTYFGIHDRCRTTPSILYMASAPAASSNRGGVTISYVGRGSSAIVREGSVLVAPSNEYHHLLTKSAIFIYEIGLNDMDELVARGVIIDHPTAFSVEEMIDESYLKETALTIGKNTLFRGGDIGEDVVMMLHSHLNKASKESEQQIVIGSSGIYQGGLSGFIDAVKRGEIVYTANTIKFFFNYLEFTEKQLDLMFSDDADSSSDDEGWMSVEVQPSIVLHTDYSRGSAWEKIRNLVRFHNY